VYYDWLERAFLGGVKLMVMHAVNNEVLCKTVNHVLSCNDMDTVDMQIAAAKHLEAHVGWYRIAYSAEQARQIINSGRMAVVLGIEVDELFNCRATGGCNGITEVSVVARDDAGNHADAATTVRVDKSVPVVGGGSPDGNWHAADAQIPCTATDAVSGLARADDASFVLTIAVPAGSETADASTSSRAVADLADNASVGGPVAGNKVDKKAPSIAIVAPFTAPATPRSTPFVSGEMRQDATRPPGGRVAHDRFRPLPADAFRAAAVLRARPPDVFRERAFRGSAL